MDFVLFILELLYMLGPERKKGSKCAGDDLGISILYCIAHYHYTKRLRCIN